jgi:chaperone modulatory protein CbpM
MQAETRTVFWLDQSQYVSLGELAETSGMSDSEVMELVDAGALMPINVEALPWTFSADCVITLRKAARLRRDLELDSHAVALVLTLLEQIQNLEATLSQLRAERPVFRRS